MLVFDLRRFRSDVRLWIRDQGWGGRAQLMREAKLPPATASRFLDDYDYEFTNIQHLTRIASVCGLKLADYIVARQKDYILV